MVGESTELENNMKEKVVLKRDVEIELYCECDGVAFSTVWSPGSPWHLQINQDDVELKTSKKWAIGDFLYVFNAAKVKFDNIIQRLEREYKQFNSVIKELPKAE